MDVKVGDKVRSFDFTSRDLTGERANYIEGVVTAMGAPPRDVCACNEHFHIQITKVVRGGIDKVFHKAIGHHVYPAFNWSNLEVIK